MDSINETIDKVFPEIRKELGYNEVIKDYDWLRDLLASLNELGFLLKLIFVAIVVAIIVFVIYKLILSFTKSNNSIDRSRKLSQESNELSLAKLLEKIELLKKQGDYITALLFIHYGTIKYLKEKGIIREDRDYTNREILSIISDKPFLETFRIIAIKAQGILFNDEFIDDIEFRLLEDKFHEEFM